MSRIGVGDNVRLSNLEGDESELNGVVGKVSQIQCSGRSANSCDNSKTTGACLVTVDVDIFGRIIPTEVKCHQVQPE